MPVQDAAYTQRQSSAVSALIVCISVIVTETLCLFIDYSPSFFSFDASRRLYVVFIAFPG